jgi:hypothetical protein
VKAELISRMPVKDYVQTNFDFMYEIKTDNYQKIVLDCQGFIKGMRFYYNDQEERLIYMDEEVCDEANKFLSDSKVNGEPVCLELDADLNSILFSRKTTDCE